MKRARLAGALSGTHESAQLPRCGADVQTGAGLSPSSYRREWLAGFLPADDSHGLAHDVKCEREPDGITLARVTTFLDSPAGWSHKFSYG